MTRYATAAACAALLLGLSLARAVTATDADAAATVNGTPISAAMVRDVVRGLINNGGPPPSSEDISRLSDAALASLIDLELLHQDARARGLTVSDAEVNAEIDRTRARFGSADAYSQALKQSGMSETALREDTRKTLLVNKLLTTVVWKDIHIAPEAARQFYDENRGEFTKDGKLTPFADAEPAIVAALRKAEERRRQADFVVELRRQARIEMPTPGR